MKRKQMFCLLMGFAVTVANAQLLPSSEEASLLAEHQQDLAMQAKIASEEAYEELCIKFDVPRVKKQHLTMLLENRELRKLAYNYVYPNSAYKRVRSRVSIDSLFQDSIDLVLIPFNGSIAGENMSYVLKAGKACQLDDAQRKHIEQQALNMARQLRKNPRANVWKQEMSVLRKTLTEEQQRRFFSLKNGKKVGTKLKEDWAKLCDNGLAAELDSIKDRAKAGKYYNLQYQIMDLYKYDNSARKRHLAELSKQMPQWVKLVDALEKRKRVDARKKEVSKDFVW